MTDFPDLVNVHYFDGMSSGGDGQETVIEDGRLKARNPLYIDPTAAPYNIKMDGETTTAASMSSSSNPTRLTVTGRTFTSADVGKVIKVVGAGSGGANLKTTITGVAAGKAVLDDPCLTTVSDVFCIFGTDNVVGLNQLFADLSNTSRSRKLSRIAVFPMGVAMHSGTLLYPFGGTVKGASENWQNYFIIYGNRGDGAEETGGTVLYQIWDQNVDCGRVRVPVWANDWQGMLTGFAIIQDADNTSGRGLSFRASDGSTAKVIDGGTINRVAVMGTANDGFEFPGGSVTATFRDLQAFACGYMGRKVFTANTTNGSAVLSSVSDFTGLAAGDIVSGPGLPPDVTIQSLDSGAGTVTLGRGCTATATGVSLQRLGNPGILYKAQGSEAVHFDSPSGDQNSGGLLRLSSGGGTQTNVSIAVTNLKNEYGVNVYREDRLDTVSPGDPSVPQGENAIVIDNLTGAKVSIRNLIHWADASSSVGGTYPNTLGRNIGAPMLVTNAGTSAPNITYDGVNVRFATGQGQTSADVLRDNHSSTLTPVNAVLSSRGANVHEARGYRGISDANATVAVNHPFVQWLTLTAARTGTLPAISAVPVGFPVVLSDKSGNASSTVTITAVAAGSDTIVGDSAIASPYGELVLKSDGTRWVGVSATVVATHAATSKSTPVDADEIPLADSAATFGLKKLTWANLKATILAAIGPGTHAATSKSTPVDADEIPLADSAASNALKRLTMANLKTAVQFTSQLFTSSGTFTAPATGTYRYSAWGGGGGGGGGGAAALTGGTSTQVGGSGGGAGQFAEAVVSLNAGDTVTVTIGAGGTGGTGGTASSDTNGHAGSGSTNGGNTTVGSLTANGGSLGTNGGANSASQVNAGVYGGGPTAASTGSSNLPGCGGTASSTSGNIAGAGTGLSGRGGGGGGPANASNGGSAGTGGFINTKTGTTAGGSATNAAANTGQGGDGGGGGAPGGAGGNGANGGSGGVIITRIG